jgi:hypothetical protein
MTGVEALEMLRAHALLLRERAIRLEATFTRPATKDYASLLVISVEDKMAVLAELTPTKLRASVMGLLLEPAERIRALEALLLAGGANADLPPGGAAGPPA